jgi:hypothetical protein
MSLVKLLLAFAPWLSFLVIARGSLFNLKLGLIVALVLSLIMGVAKLHRGVILWAGLIFFIFASLAVVAFDNMWTAQHMGILANGMLAGSTWLTVVMKKPFTLDYAREHTDPSLWNSPPFLKTNYLLTSVWGAVFSVNIIMAYGKMEHFVLSELGYEIVTYLFLIGTAIFTNWYPKYVRRQRESEEQSVNLDEASST